MRTPEVGGKEEMKRRKKKKRKEKSALGDWGRDGKGTMEADGSII